MPKALDLIGQKFGRLSVLRKGPAHVSISGKKFTQWICSCACGNQTVVLTQSLRSKLTVSCGCYHNESAAIRCIGRLTTHGMARTKIYGVWRTMIARCHNPATISFEDYGHRGISVCDSWRDSFDQFLKDMGRPPKGCSLDRIDNSLGYSKENCRWATCKQQMRNKRSNRVLEIDGQRKTMVEWSEVTEISYHTIKRRLGLGWSHRQAVFSPLRKKNG